MFFFESFWTGVIDGIHVLTIVNVAFFLLTIGWFSKCKPNTFFVLGSLYIAISILAASVYTFQLIPYLGYLVEFAKAYYFGVGVVFVLIGMLILKMRSARECPKPIDKICQMCFSHWLSIGLVLCFGFCTTIMWHVLMGFFPYSNILNSLYAMPLQSSQALVGLVVYTLGHVTWLILACFIGAFFVNTDNTIWNKPFIKMICAGTLIGLGIGLMIIVK